MSNGIDPLAILRELPKWCKSVVGGIIVVALGFYAYGRFVKPELVDPNTLPMPISELMQLREAQFHFAEEPCGELQLEGEGLMRYYCEDHPCTATYWTRNGHTVPRFNIHPDRLLTLEADMAGVFFGVKRDCPKRRCLPPNEHPGEWEQHETPDEREECWIWIWREWPDGCLQYQRFNHCEKEWVDEEPIWECCVHN